MTTLHTLDVAPYDVSWHGASWRDILPPSEIDTHRAGTWSVKKGTYTERVRQVVGATWMSQREILTETGGRKDAIANTVYLLHRRGEFERESIVMRGRARYRYRTAQVS